MEEANRTANMARNFMIASIVIGVIVIVLSTVLRLMAAQQARDTYGY